MSRFANRRRELSRAVVETLECRRLLTRFAVIGDYSSNDQVAPTRDVANLVKSWSPAFVATVGDNNYPDGAASTIDDNVGQWYHQFLYPYNGNYGSGASDQTNHFFPAIGNHDWNSSAGYSPYTNYFNLPGNERYYTTRQGDVELFIVNDDVHEPDGNTASSAQAQWLQGALAASTATFKLVLFHHPPYSSSDGGGQTPSMRWPFQQWGATAVIAGHDHTYERIDKNGFPYFVNGLGGESIFGFGTPISGSQVRYESNYGAMLIETSGNSINFKFINRNGTQIDNFTMNVSNPTPTAPNAPTNLVATPFSSSQIQLTWADNSDNETSFKVERSPDGSTGWLQIGTTGSASGTGTFTDSGRTSGVTYYYHVRASNSVGDSDYTNVASAAPTAATLPAPWVDGDVGSTGVAGSGDFAGGAFTVRGGGSDIWGTNDSFNFVYQQLAGDGQIVARVTGVQNVNSGSHGGVMIRESLAANAKEASVVLTAGSGIGFVRRTSTGGSSSVTTASGVAPYWLKLVRAGSTFTASRSTDGNTWTAIGSASISMAANIYVGLVACSKNTSALCTTTYTNVAVSGAAPAAPAAPSNLVATAVSTSQINLTWTDNSSNETGFILERSLDGSTGWTPLNPAPAANATSYGDSGLSASTQYFYRVRAVNGALESANSNVANATTQSAPVAPAAPNSLVATSVSSSQINLTWTDNANNETGFIVERSLDGSTGWTQVGTPAANATSFNNTTGLSPSTQYFYRVRAVNGALASANSNVANATTQAAVGLPAPWADGDIGTVGAAGSASASGGVFTLKGAGTDIWGTADGFHFVYQPWTGNGQIVARVTAVQNTNSGAQAGIMFRESLAANAKEACIVLTPSSGTAFVRRTSTGGSSSYTAASATVPYWFKLIRNGNSFTAYRSSNGTSWTQIGSAVTISMTSTIYVGLLVCSKVTGTLNTSTIDNVTVSSSTAINLAVAQAAAASAQSQSAFSVVPITAASAEPDQKKELLELLA